MNNNFLMLVVLVVNSWSAKAYAADDSKTPEVKAWSQTWVKEGNLGKGAFIRKLVFVKDLMPGDIPVFLSLKSDVFSNLGYFELIDGADISWSYKLNRSQLASFKRKGPADPQLQLELVDLFKVSGADTVI